MSKENGDRTFWIIIVTMVLTLAGAVAYVVHEQPRIEREQAEIHWEQGRRAYRAGIPANATPHKTGTVDAKQWLDGYVGESEHAKNKGS